MKIILVFNLIKFQVGDRVTRGLLAVSQLCCSGAGVWFVQTPRGKRFGVGGRGRGGDMPRPSTPLAHKRGACLVAPAILPVLLCCPHGLPHNMPGAVFAIE